MSRWIERLHLVPECVCVFVTHFSHVKWRSRLRAVPYYKTNAKYLQLWGRSDKWDNNSYHRIHLLSCGGAHSTWAHVRRVHQIGQNGANGWRWPSTWHAMARCTACINAITMTKLLCTKLHAADATGRCQRRFTSQLYVALPFRSARAMQLVGLRTIVLPLIAYFFYSRAHCAPMCSERQKENQQKKIEGKMEC